jgi:hypothetical protein
MRSSVAAIVAGPRATTARFSRDSTGVSVDADVTSRPFARHRGDDELDDRRHVRVHVALDPFRRQHLVAGSSRTSGGARHAVPARTPDHRPTTSIIDG